MHSLLILYKSIFVLTNTLPADIYKLIYIWVICSHVFEQIFVLKIESIKVFHFILIYIPYVISSHVFTLTDRGDPPRTPSRRP